MEIGDLEEKWVELEKTLKLLIQNNPEPYKRICQEKLDNIKKMREHALLVFGKDSI